MSNPTPPSPNAPRPKRPRPAKATPRAVEAPPVQRPPFDWARFKSRVIAGAPGALASIGIHVFIGAILGVVVYTIEPRRADELREISWAPDTEGDGDGGPVVPNVRIESVSGTPTGGNAEMAAKTPMESPAETPMTAESPMGPVAVKPVDVSNALRNRGGGGGKGGGAGGTGGKGMGGGSGTGGEGTGAEADVQKTIEKSLAWIVRQQQKDGHWSLNGPYDDGGTIQTNTGATALALLALVGDGNTHQLGTHQAAVQRGIEWLRGVQKPSGDLFDVAEQGKEAHYYSHAQATIALCEVLALSNDETLRPVATKAVEFLIRSQNPKLGGWKYRPLAEDGIGDLSVTGWALMALHSARMARIDVNPESFLLASSFLDSVQAAPDDPSRYRYRPDEPANVSQDMSMTAEGLLCRQWLGWPKEHPPLQQGVGFLLSDRNAPEWKDDRRNVYAWYYTSQALHNMGGDHWNTWFRQVAPLIVKAQNAGGKNGGSWNPTRPRGAFLEWSHGAGRLYFTVMCTLILETPNRHAPIYE
jgi:hypothetical protein